MRALEFIRDHVTFKLPYDFSYQMKTPIDLNACNKMFFFSLLFILSWSKIRAFIILQCPTWLKSSRGYSIIFNVSRPILVWSGRFLHHWKYHLSRALWNTFNNGNNGFWAGWKKIVSYFPFIILLIWHLLGKLWILKRNCHWLMWEREKMSNAPFHNRGCNFCCFSLCLFKALSLILL